MTPTDTDHLDNQFIALLTIVAAELPAAAAAIGLTATDNLEAAVLDPLIKEVASRSRSQLTPIKGEHNRLENFRNPVLDRVLGPIDLTFRTEDQQTVLGEVKWSGATKGPGLISSRLGTQSSLLPPLLNTRTSFAAT